MVDVQSTAADIRRGKEEERRKKKPQGKNIMSASATQGGHINNNSPEFGKVTSLRLLRGGIWNKTLRM